ncbi:hypothetical protein GCM10009748_23590 [Agromyces lapidis]
MTLEDRAASIVLETRRAELGMSKAELARRTGISERTVKYYLASERAMTVGAYHAIRTVLQLTREEGARLVASQLATLEDSDQ